MMRVFLFLILCPASIFAQFQDLATTGNGGHLYFSSALELRGGGEYPYPKIFRYDGNLFLFAQQNLELPYIGAKTNFYQLVGPSVSGGSTALADTAVADCSGGSRCLCFELVVSM